MEYFSLLTNDIIKEYIIKVKKVPRKRINYNFHKYEDNVQKMLNFIEPDSFIRPHRHLTPPKTEFFLVLSGKFFVIFFDDNGNINNVFKLDKNNIMGIDIKPGVWHTIISLKKDGVIFEIKDGPYDPSTDKEFPLWAPQENSGESGIYLKNLVKNAKLFLKNKKESL